MSLLVFLLLLALTGLIVGALARLAVPGPDPMSIWGTIALGVVGSFLGGLVARWLGYAGGGGILFAVLGAMVVLIAWRRLAQGRGITGPSARRP